MVLTTDKDIAGNDIEPHDKRKRNDMVGGNENTSIFVQ